MKVSKKRREQLRRYSREYWQRNKDQINRKRRAKYAKEKKQAQREKEGSDSGLHRPIL